MKTLKALGGALLAIVIMIASNILASVAASGLILINAPEWLAIAVMGILYIVFVLLAVRLIYVKAFKFKPAELGMPKPALKPACIVLAVLLPVVVCAAFFLFAKGEFVKASADGNRASLLAEGIVYNGIAAAIAEEVLFRGVLLNVFRKRWNTVVGVIVPSVIFGLIHITEMQEFNLLDCIQLVVAGTLVGIMFSVIAVRTGSVWNSAVVHSVWNLVMAGGIVKIGSAPSENALVNYVLNSKSFALTGGAFGVESSVIAIAAYAAVALILVFAWKSEKHTVSAI